MGEGWHAGRLRAGTPTVRADVDALSGGPATPVHIENGWFSSAATRVVAAGTVKSWQTLVDHGPTISAWDADGRPIPVQRPSL